jgi:hypothetical protein
MDQHHGINTTVIGASSEEPTQTCRHRRSQGRCERFFLAGGIDGASRTKNAPRGRFAGCKLRNGVTAAARVKPA